MGSFCELFIPHLAIETGEIWNTPEHSHLQKKMYMLYVYKDVVEYQV